MNIDFPLSIRGETSDNQGCLRGSGLLGSKCLQKFSIPGSQEFYRRDSCAGTYEPGRFQSSFT